MMKSPNQVCRWKNVELKADGGYNSYNLVKKAGVALGKMYCAFPFGQLPLYFLPKKEDLHPSSRP